MELPIGTEKAGVDKPLVSLIICCHNRAELLPRTMESAFTQSYRPTEIIVLDDGSEDGTAQLMASYGDRIRYHRHQNQGIAAARSNACRMARGEYIAFLDDDDLIPPGRIGLLLEALQEHPQAVFAVGDLAVIDEQGNPTGRRWLPEGALGRSRTLFERGDEAVLWPHVPAAPHTTLFRRSDGERIGWFDRQYRFAAEDKDFFARLGRLGAVVHVPEVVSLYRQGHSSLTNNSQRTLYSQLLLFRNHLQSLDSGRAEFRRRLQWRILHTLRQMRQNEAAGMEIAGDIPEDYLRGALRQLSFADRARYRLFSAKVFLRRHIAGAGEADSEGRNEQEAA